MCITSVRFGVCFVGLVLATPASAQPGDDSAKAIVEVHGRMNQAIETKAFQDPLPFAKFLELLGKQLSTESPFVVGLDRDGFGKEAEKLLAKPVNLPAIPHKMIAATALRLTLSQATTVREIELRAAPGKLVITTRDRSFYTARYDLRDVIEHTTYLHKSFAEMKRRHAETYKAMDPAIEFDETADPKKPADWIVRQILSDSETARAGWHKRTPGSTMEVRNGNLLIVHTVPSVHRWIQSMLASYRRLADLAVVMYARLYALDRAEYENHFAPASVDSKGKSIPPVALLTEAQRKRLAAHKPMMEGHADKLRPFERAAFLSWRKAYQFQSRPGAGQLTTAFEGVNFAVRPFVSPDRRCLRLELFQEVAQLVKITQGTMIDLKTGKEVEIELPNVMKSSTTGSIDIHDTQPILWAVDYRSKNQVWLLVAEPRIYMEEEEELYRKLAIVPMLLADAKPPPPEPVEEYKAPVKLPAVELPNTAEMRQLLQAIVLQVMTDPPLKEYRVLYGTPNDKRFALVNGDTLAWPKTFRPEVAGFQLQPFDPDECRSFKPRMLGIHLENYARLPKTQAGWDVSVEVILNNAGGDGISGYHRNCPVHCRAKRAGERWIVDCEPRPFGE